MKPAATTRGTGTARPSGRVSSLSALALLASLLAGGLPSHAHAQSGGGIGSSIAPPVFTPGLRASAVYSDNILLAPRGQEEGDLLLEVSPSLSAFSNAPRAKYNVFYQLRNLWRVNEGETSLFRHTLNANGTFALGDDRLWLDLSGYMGTLNGSALGPISEDPGASFVNTSKLRRFSVSPWFRDRIGGLATYQLRYYLAHAGGDNDFALARLDQRASASVDSIVSGASPWGWRWYAEYQHREFDANVTRSRRQTGGVLSYRLSTDLRVFGTVDYEQFDRVLNRDGDDNGWGPGAGFSWNPGPRTNVAGSISRRYYGTIGNARFAYWTPTSVAGAQYSRSMLTSSDASLLLFDPGAITSVGLEGASPVLESLINTGVVLQRDPTLMQTLVTDAAVRDRRLTAFYGLRGGRNALTLSAFLSDRESTAELGPTGAASGLFASSAAGGAFIGEIQERGLVATYQHRLDARSAVTVAANGSRHSSSTAGFNTRVLTLRAGYTMQLTSDTGLFTGIRRTRQTASGIAVTYDENAVYGGLDMRFR